MKTVNELKRQKLAARDGLVCPYCKEFMPEDDRTIDHVFPRSKGGRSKLNNLVLAHKRCNGLKSDKTDIPIVKETGPENWNH